MYSAPYGYPNAAAGGAPGSNFNGAPPQQNPHLQAGPSPNQQQPGMMYNPQQFPMGPQGPFPGGAPNPAAAMMGGTGPPGMMQMAANGQGKLPHHGRLLCLTCFYRSTATSLPTSSLCRKLCCL
jgi:hypothetical protein